MIYDFKNEDALAYVKSLPSASIDLVLTDPPYTFNGYKDSSDLITEHSQDILRLNENMKLF